MNMTMSIAIEWLNTFIIKFGECRLGIVEKKMRDHHRMDPS